MQFKNSYFTIGWLKTKYPIENIKGFRKMNIVVRNIHRKRNKWFVVDLPFTISGEGLEAVELIQVGTEVTVHFSIKTRYWIKDGVVQQRNGMDSLFLELSAWKVFSHTDRVKDMNDKIWTIKNFDEVKANADAENTEPLRDTDQKEKFPSNKRYDANDFNPKVNFESPEVADEGDDDLPF